MEKELSTGISNDATVERRNYFSQKDRKVRQLRDYNRDMNYKSEVMAARNSRFSKIVLFSSYVTTGALVTAGVVTSNIAYLVGAVSTITLSSALYSLNNRE